MFPSHDLEDSYYEVRVRKFCPTPNEAENCLIHGDHDCWDWLYHLESCSYELCMRKGVEYAVNETLKDDASEGFEK
jgi:hypothetical protein